MNRLLAINASMRSADLGHLASQLARLEAGGIDALHFDVMDGRFGPEISMGPMFLRGLRSYTRVPFEVHLWVSEPGRSLDRYIDAGADCIIIHLEASSDPAADLSRIRASGAEAGLALNPATLPEKLLPFLHLCEKVNVMTIAPGVPGELTEHGLQNLRQTAELIARHCQAATVQADGAVSLKTRDMLVEAGAVALVVGYPIFSRSDFGSAIAELRYGARE